MKTYKALMNKLGIQEIPKKNFTRQLTGLFLAVAIPFSVTWMVKETQMPIELRVLIVIGAILLSETICITLKRQIENYEMVRAELILEKVKASFDQKVFALNDKSLKTKQLKESIKKLNPAIFEIVKVDELLLDELNTIVFIAFLCMALVILNRKIFIVIATISIAFYFLKKKAFELDILTTKKETNALESNEKFVENSINGLAELKSLGIKSLFQKETPKNQKVFLINRINLLQVSQFLLAIFVLYLYERSSILWTVGLLILYIGFQLNQSIIEVIELDLKKKYYLDKTKAVVEFLNQECKEEIKEEPLKDFNTLELKDIGCSFDSKRFLKDVNIKVEKGTNYAIVCTKKEEGHALLKLLSSRVPLDKGTYEINGEDVTNGNSSLSELFFTVKEKPFFFHKNIVEYYQLANDKVTTKEVKAIVESLGLKEWFENVEDSYKKDLDHIYDAVIQQKIALGAVLLTDASILLIEETEAITNESLLNIIKKFPKEYTTLIVTNRFATMIDAKKIAFIHDGKIMGIGTHEQLLQKSKQYQQLMDTNIHQGFIEQNLL